jgi:CRISPR system Cascade subunit CasA
MLNVLTEPMLRVRSHEEGVTGATLPAVLAALVRDDRSPGATEVAEMPAVRPHQRHAWHAFTVQLAALALHRAGQSDAPADEPTWAALLRRLTPDWPNDEPWCLVAPPDLPALLQPPVPGGSLAAFKAVATTPDALDVLVTADNHDLKRQVMAGARPEDWLLALVSLQTMEGVMGRGNYGISRMNGGYASRPALGVVRSGGQGARFVRDLNVLLSNRERILRAHDLKADGGLGLLWLQPWDGQSQIRFSDLDPFYIEVCRRVRLVTEGEALIARTAGSSKARIAATGLNGRTGDAWTPIELTNRAAKALPEPKALTITGEGFSYAKMTELLFGTRYQPAIAQEFAAEDPEVNLAVLASGLARGQGKTDGYHERTVPIPKHVRPRVRARATDKLAQWAKERVEEAGILRGKVLRPALFVLLQDGPEQVNFRDAATCARADKVLDRLDREIDATFFDELWLEAEKAEAGDDARQAVRHAWQARLLKVAHRLLLEAADAVPHAWMRRYRARVRAEGTFFGTRNKHFSHLQDKEDQRDHA